MPTRFHTVWLPVALGGALGASARHILALASLAILGADFPWGTLLANGLGSLLIGFVAAWMSDDRAAQDGETRMSEARRQFLVAGFCGGFTTFSVFSLEMLMLLEAGRIGEAMFYLGASLIVWLSAVAAGFETGRRLNRLA